MSSTAPLKRTLFHLTGSDAKRYLSGQCSQDLALATSNQACYATILNHKGKMDADLYVREYDGGILVDADPSLREDLHMRLDRYIIADDVEIADLSDSHLILHTLGDETQGASAQAWKINRFGVNATEELCAQGDSTEATLPSGTPTQSVLGFEELEQIRIQHMIPSWGAELGNETLPPEAGLEDRAISYTKGCYTGQEVISRMRSAGRTNRKLALLELSAAVSAPAALMAEGATPEKPAGTLTSSCSIDGKHIGLAFIGKKFYSQSEFQVGNTTATVTKII